MEAGHHSNNDIRPIFDRINTLEDMKKITADDIKDVYAEAKSKGFNPAALRAVVRKHRADAKKAEELQDEVDAYMAALGML